MLINGAPESRSIVFDDILTLMKGGISISGAIWRMEKMYNPNMIEDM